MAKRVDPLKAKQAKQKKLAIGLCLLLVAVLAFQGPKTLKMLKGPQAPTAAPAATTTTSAAAPAGAPVTPSIDGVPPTAAGGAPAVGVAQPAVLIDSDVPAEADDGQLLSFELFQAKDPFAPQNAGVITVPGSTPATAPESPASAKPAAAKPATPAPDGVVIAPSPSATDPDSAAPASAGATPPAASGATAATASATSISVNGIAADVAVEGTFPAAAPAFVLVSVAKDGKSVQIGVAGGSYADGAKTIKLTVGKRLTLRNTADGSEYVLLLNTVAGFTPPKQ